MKRAKLRRLQRNACAYAPVSWPRGPHSERRRGTSWRARGAPSHHDGCRFGHAPPTLDANGHRPHARWDFRHGRTGRCRLRCTTAWRHGVRPLPARTPGVQDQSERGVAGRVKTSCGHPDGPHASVAIGPNRPGAARGSRVAASIPGANPPAPARAGTSRAGRQSGKRWRSRIRERGLPNWTRCQICPIQTGPLPPARWQRRSEPRTRRTRR
jgi:hypothetical protein